MSTSDFLSMSDDDTIVIKKEDHLVSGCLQQTADHEYAVKFGELVDIIGKHLLDRGWIKHAK